MIVACIEFCRRITRCEVILCVWHVQREWLKNVNQLDTSKEKTNEMFSELGFIMKHSSSVEVSSAIDGIFNKFANEKKFLDYFYNNWVTGDKICKCTCFFFCFHFFSNKYEISTLTQFFTFRDVGKRLLRISSGKSRDQ